MSRSLPKILESQRTYINLSVMILASWFNAPRGLSKERGIFLGWGLSYQCNRV